MLWPGKKSSPLSEINKFRIYNRMVNEGKIRNAVRFLTDRTGGGVVSPECIDKQSKSSVFEMLQKKNIHPQESLK